MPYLIATDVQCQPLREEIERLFADLPAPSPDNVMGKLRSEENFWQTYHELVVGGFLMKRGLRIECDKKLDDLAPDLTPDWFASTSDGVESMIVEVFTENISAWKRSKPRNWKICSGGLQTSELMLNSRFRSKRRIVISIHVATSESRLD